MNIIISYFLYREVTPPPPNTPFPNNFQKIILLILFLFSDKGMDFYVLFLLNLLKNEITKPDNKNLQPARLKCYARF